MKVKVMRMLKGIKSQKELCDLTGIGLTTMVKIEKGDIDSVKLGSLKKVAAALDTSVVELFFN